MSGRYERVNSHDVDEPQSPLVTSPRHAQQIPNSPPPSFRSRTSSITSREALVDPALADAFDTDGDNSDDDDDRQRLVRSNLSPTTADPPPSTAPSWLSALPSQNPDLATVGGPATPFRTYGGGIQSDGVFSNLAAKPELGGDEKEEQPPTYEQAAADAAPPYWETTILAPGLGGPDEVYIDGMPVGSVFSFIWNGMISMSFQLIGFLLTYLLHSTHAAKNGSRAGLGITLIQSGFFMRNLDGTGAGGMGDGHMGGAGEGYADPSDPNAHDFDPNSVGNEGSSDGGGSIADIVTSEWAAYILMIVGWFVLIRAVTDYLKARRHEQLVLQSPDRGLGVAVVAEGEDPERVV